MRILLTSLVAMSLAAGPLRAAECVHPTDMVAMDIMALKTQLMVTALTCKVSDKYNAFIQKYQPELQREDKSLNTYFSRTYGRAGAKQHDDYVTRLANTNSSNGLKQGSLYCDQAVPVFDEVLSLRSNAELPEYAAGRAGEQPISTSACGETTSRPTRAAAHTTTRRRS